MPIFASPFDSPGSSYSFKTAEHTSILDIEMSNSQGSSSSNDEIRGLIGSLATTFKFQIDQNKLKMERMKCMRCRI